MKLFPASVVSVIGRMNFRGPVLIVGIAYVNALLTIASPVASVSRDNCHPAARR